MTPMQTLAPAARAQLTPAFRQGHATVGLREYLQPVPDGHDVPVAELGILLDEARSRYEEDPARSDRWLAPRLHALLRLDRKHGGDSRIWAWLATVECPEYVRWRFPGKGDEEEDEAKRGTALKRFLGQDRDNALSRLWWGGELCRDGGDYVPVEQAFIVQDVPNTWFSLDAFHHPACAQAALRLLPSMGSRPVNRLATAMDHVLTTIQLDVVAPALPPDTAAVTEWREQEISLEALLEEGLPEGPDESQVDPAQIDAVEALLRRVASEIDLELPV